MTLLDTVIRIGGAVCVIYALGCAVAILVVVFCYLLERRRP